MSLMLVSTEELGLAAKLRNRVTEGAAIAELSTAEMPAWLAGAVGSAAVESVFVSQHGAVAVLQNGGRVVCRAPRA